MLLAVACYHAVLADDQKYNPAQKKVQAGGNSDAQTDQFLRVKLRGSDPFARGVQYGQQAEALIRRAIEGYHRQFQKSVDQSWDAVVKRSHYYTDFVNEHYPEEFQEMLGIAEGSGVAVDEIMALNCRYEILKLKLQECTTGATLKEAAAGRYTCCKTGTHRHGWSAMR